MKALKKPWITLLALALLVLCLASPVHAQDTGPTIDTVNTSVQNVSMDVNTMWLLITGFLVFFMQAGFALVETGFTRNKNVNHTMMMNMMVFCIGAVGYWLTGFALQFGSINYTYPALGNLSAFSFSPITLTNWSARAWPAHY